MQNITILILEDEPVIANHLQEIAEENNYHVVTAITSHQAFDYLKKNTPHLAILDIKLEGEEHDGFDVAKAVALKGQAEKVNIPIAFHTAYAEDENIKQKAEETVGYACLLQKGKFAIDDQLIELIEEKASAYFSKLEEKKDEEYKQLTINREGAIIIRPKIKIDEEDDNKPGKKLEKLRYIILHVDNILFIEAIDGKAKIVTEDQVYWLTISLEYLMRQFQEKLPEAEHNKLCIAHKSHIVNAGKIVAFDKHARQDYVYFEVDDPPSRGGVPVRALFIQTLKQRLSDPINTKKRGGTK